jgi:hypothetical protein
MHELPEGASPPAEYISADVGVDRWLHRLNWTVAFVVFLVVGGVIGFNLSGNLSRAKNPRCGLDWIMAAWGSDETFESMLQERIAKSQADFEKQNPELFKPAFDVSEPLEFHPEDFTGFTPSAFDR